MKMIDKISLRDIIEQMLQLIHTKCEIATLVAKIKTHQSISTNRQWICRLVF